jgi:hypothetical protein
MGKNITIKTEKAGGTFTLPAYKATAYENGSVIAEAYSKPFGTAEEARENLADKLAAREANKRK